MGGAEFKRGVRAPLASPLAMALHRPHQRCTGTGVSVWTPAGVLTNFENRSGAGADFFKEGPEPESFYEYKVGFLITDYYYRRLFFFTKHVIM